MEQIALMKPKALTEHGEGMLEFLEDIIGTSALKEPIELLDKRVEELGEERGEKVSDGVCQCGHNVVVVNPMSSMSWNTAHPVYPVSLYPWMAWNTAHPDSQGTRAIHGLSPDVHMYH